MRTLKRWTAGLLAGLFLFSACFAFAEKTGGDSTVRIQESLVSREGEAPDSLEDTFRMLIRLSQREEVRNMLKIEDVSSIFTDVILKVLEWMDQNRPVTDKILTELGIGEDDLGCINKIWDSADRIAEATRTFQDSETGQRLEREFTELFMDPDFRESVSNFQALVSAEEVENVLSALQQTVESGKEVSETSDVKLTDEALERQLGRASFTGSLLIVLLEEIQQSAWGRDSLPKLLKNESLRTLLTDLAATDTELDKVIREEISSLLTDQEVTDFIFRASRSATNVINEYKSLSDSVGESVETAQEETEETGNE